MLWSRAAGRWRYTAGKRDEKSAEISAKSLPEFIDPAPGQAGIEPL
jgi:hypothetical protein